MTVKKGSPHAFIMVDSPGAKISTLYLLQLNSLCRAMNLQSRRNRHKKLLTLLENIVLE